MSARNSVIVHQGLVAPYSNPGLLLHTQPETLLDLTLAEEVTWLLTPLGIQGSADSWYLRTRFQLGQWNTTGYLFTAPNFSDLQAEQITKLITEGVDWYAGADRVPSAVTNLAPSPSAPFTNWEGITGTGGVVSESIPSDGGVAGSSYKRVTWTTGTSAPSGGIRVKSVPVTAGQVYSCLMRARPSKTQPLQIGFDWIDASNAVISSAFASSKSFAAGAWLGGWQLNATAPANAVTANIIVKAGGAATNWAAGDTLDADGCVVVQASALSLDAMDPLAAKTSGAFTGVSKVAARSGDAFPVTIARTLRSFGPLARMVIVPVAANPSADFAVRYSLAASYRIG